MNLGCIPRILHGHATPSSTLLPSRCPRSASPAEWAARAALGIAEAILQRSARRLLHHRTAMAEVTAARPSRGRWRARALPGPGAWAFVGEPPDQVCPHKVGDDIGVVHVQRR